MGLSGVFRERVQTHLVFSGFLVWGSGKVGLFGLAGIGFRTHLARFAGRPQGTMTSSVATKMMALVCHFTMCKKQGFKCSRTYMYNRTEYEQHSDHRPCTFARRPVPKQGTFQYEDTTTWLPAGRKQMQWVVHMRRILNRVSCNSGADKQCTSTPSIPKA